MLRFVRDTLARHGMVPPGARVLVAVSGGADSTCLLHVLRELEIPLVGIAHVNHQLRGTESEEDEEFVVNLSNKMGLPCFTTRGRGCVRGNLEQGLSRMRREFFASLLAAGTGTHVALGHTRDDQAETVLFRLLRGSGLTGLAGILPVTREGLIRPLLEATHDQVTAYLRMRNIPWREDSSNHSTEFRRNRLRHQLLPQLKTDWNPQLAASLAELASLAYEEERDWAVRLSRAARLTLRPSAPQPAVEVDLQRLTKTSLAMQRRLLRFAIKQVLGNLRGIEYGHIERILELAHQAQGAGRVQVPGLEACRSFGWLRLASPSVSMELPSQRVRIPGVYDWPDAELHLALNQALNQGSNPGPCDTLKKNIAALKLELRGWQPGDQYTPARGGRLRKLHDLFQSARIPSWRRSSWPILVSKGYGIVWAREFGPAQEFTEDRNSVGAVRIWEEEISRP